MPCIKPDRPLLGWSFDLITELEVTAEGYQYLLVGFDCFSKWVVISPLQTKPSEYIGDWFFQYFLPHYGKPQWVCIDAGKDFEGVFASMLASLGVTVC